MFFFVFWLPALLQSYTSLFSLVLVLLGYFSRPFSSSFDLSNLPFTWYFRLFPFYSKQFGPMLDWTGQDWTNLAQFSSAQLSRIQLNSVWLSSAQPSSTQLNSAQFSSAQLSSIQLNSAQLSSAQHSSTQLTSAQLSSAQFSSTFPLQYSWQSAKDR